MCWTEARVETLKQFWMNGLSASLIATKLGDDITRNAVIGKVHRLGLPGRRTALRRKPSLSLSAFAGCHKDNITRRSKPMRRPARFSLREDKPSLRYLPDLAPAPEHAVTVQTLTAFTCRFPIGDPKQPGFHFCGGASLETQAYCDHHAAIAYRPARRLSA